MATEQNQATEKQVQRITSQLAYFGREYSEADISALTKQEASSRIRELNDEQAAHRPPSERDLTQYNVAVRSRSEGGRCAT